MRETIKQPPDVGDVATFKGCGGDPMFKRPSQKMMFFLEGYGKLSRNFLISVFFWGVLGFRTFNNVCIVNLMWSEDADVLFGEDGTPEGFLDDEG